MWYIIALIILVIGLITCLLPERYFKKLNNGIIGGVMMVIAIDMVLMVTVSDLIKWLIEVL